MSMAEAGEAAVERFARLVERVLGVPAAGLAALDWPALAAPGERDVAAAVREHVVAAAPERAWSEDSLAILDELIETLVVELRLHAELDELRGRLESASLTDEMTGLYNRRGFLRLAEPQVRLAVRKRRPLMLFVADLDGLAKINDQLGHDVGDDAITQAARLLARVFRQSDVLARLDSDEFVALALEAEREGPVVGRLEAALAAFNDEDGRPYQLSISIGAVTYVHDQQETLEQLLERAEARVAAVKRSRQG